MKIALIAHDKKKESMIVLAKKYADVLKEHELYATGTTGRLISLSTGLNITCMKSGPLGGDQQIGSLIAEDLLDIVIFLRDPLTPQPHETDIQALIRLCDVHYVPIATNLASAEIFVRALDNGDLDWRKLRKKHS